MKATEKLFEMIDKAETSNSWKEGIYHTLMAIAYMELCLNKEKLDTIEVK